MEPDHSPPEPLKPAADTLQALVSGPLATAASRVAGRARGIPSGRDFHFYDSFPEFKSSAREISEKSETLLKNIAASGQFWGRKGPPPLPDDLDEAFDWLVSLNDDFLERFGVSMDEFKSRRGKEEETGTKIGSLESGGGFQLVYGKKKKGAMRENEKDERSLATGVKVATKDKKTTAGRSKVPFHIPTIPRPQDEYSILVNNKNQPFEHVWLEKSEDGSRFIHPMERLSVLDFVDRNVGEGEPVKPLPLEDTPFQLVEGVKELKELAIKLRNVNEFAVDLEHNQYRSFQGLTCLMQISTRTEDFVVDTLKLRIHVGPYLREVFKDPRKRKVMHGADRDILWLQRDFGIYVCNLFDTGQGSRLLQLERNSLEYLLYHFCGVTANKEYQNADWRLRPLPEEMLKYAREDTHYLLHIYDLMKSRLLSASSNENDLLLEVYRRSSEICVQLYEKELLTDTSYLYIYGLQESNFDSKQLAVVAGLCEWRDNVARAEDESTGYVLPNKALLEIARQMPVSSGKLRWLVKSKHPFVERYLNSVISIIRSSIANASAFDNVAEQLKKGRVEALNVQSAEAADLNSESVPVIEDPIESRIAQSDVPDGNGNISSTQSVKAAAATTVAIGDCVNSADTEHLSTISSFSKGQVTKLETIPLSEAKKSFQLSDTGGTVEKQTLENGSTESLQSVKKASIASVQMLKKPTGAFGAMLGHSSSRKKLNSEGGAATDQVKSKVEQIRSKVALPFHYFPGGEKPLEPSPEVDMSNPQPEILQESPNRSAQTTMFEDVIPLENETDNSQSRAESPTTDDGIKHRNWFPPLPQNDLDGHVQPGSDIPMSPSDLSSSFERCFQSINQTGNSQENRRSLQEPEINFQLKPFDYAAARKTMTFGKIEEDEPIGEDGHKTYSESREKRKSSALSHGHGEGRGSGFQQPRRRQAFPPSGNRTTTYH